MNDRGVETVKDPVVPLEALSEMSEAVSWSRGRKEKGAYKGSRETTE